jgi:cell surface protein SprA
LNSVNIPQGSVSVTAGGVKLVENQDYTVDYNLGRVKILNQGILESGTPINVSLESNSLFSIQTKTLAGARFDYKVNKDLVLGGTVMNLYERPLTQKVNVGDEPIANTILGLDANWKRESGFVTRLVDKLPFYGHQGGQQPGRQCGGGLLDPRPQQGHWQRRYQLHRRLRGQRKHHRHAHPEPMVPGPPAARPGR